MLSRQFKIVPCPRELTARALSLVLNELPFYRRKAIVDLARTSSRKGLFVALRNQELLGACWAQLQPGNAVIFWPPRTSADQDRGVALALMKAATGWLDEMRIGLTQVSLSRPEESSITMLQEYQFRFLAELLYLHWEPGDLRQLSTQTCPLQYQAYHPRQRERLIRVIEKTYRQTLDCPLLNGTRDMNDVVDGYKASGASEPPLWFFLRNKGHDVGVLLIASHPEIRHWELTYLGLIPQVRGQRLGLGVVRYAQRLAYAAGVHNFVLAVDGKNAPAVKMYREAGFHQWDRRSVYVRFPQRGWAVKTTAA